MRIGMSTLLRTSSERWTGTAKKIKNFGTNSSQKNYTKKKPKILTLKILSEHDDESMNYVVSIRISKIQLVFCLIPPSPGSPVHI